MIKYFCDICDNEITSGEEKLGVLDFTNKFLNLCPTCKSKFKEAKESIFEEYKTLYDNLNSEYLQDLKNEILTDVDPEPVWEDPSDPPTDPEPADPEPTDPEAQWE